MPPPLYPQVLLIVAVICQKVGEVYLQKLKQIYMKELNHMNILFSPKLIENTTNETNLQDYHIKDHFILWPRAMTTKL